MKIKLVTLTTVALLAAGAGMAQTMTTGTTDSAHVWNDPHAWWGEHWVYTASPDKYNANELTLDFFGSYLAGERKAEDLFKTNIRHGVWGGGVGLNYFFCKYLGIGGDMNIPDDNFGNFINNVNGSLIARFPVANTGLAPYVFGGGGRQTDPVWEWTGHAGVGLEYRFNRYTGLFADARYMWVDKTPDEIEFRAGVRFAF